MEIYRQVNKYRANLVKFLAILTLITFFTLALRFNFNTVYRDDPINKLTAPFSYPKLRWIKSSRQRVKQLDELLFYLSEKVKKGDYLLAYNNFPLLYYLTGTRPAYGYAWIRGNEEPRDLREKLLQKMIAEKKLPVYVVHVKGDPKREDPLLNGFVHSNYFLEKIIFPFEIWHKK